MNQKELKRICDSACEIVTEVAEFIRGEAGKVGEEAVHTKSRNSLVSYVDLTAEKKLVEGLGQLLPDSVFLTEEKTVDTQSGEYQWIIDPLDGTTNFLHQLPCFAVSVALRHGEETILGIVYEVNQKECFYAWQGGGAYLNGQKIGVSQTKALKDALLATGFPYHDFSLIESYYRVFADFMRLTRGIRRFGAAAVDLVYVACGRFDAFFEYGLNPWDVAAGALIVREAGGKAFDFRGGEDYLFGKEMIAANGIIAEEVLEVVRKEFYPN